MLYVDTFYGIIHQFSPPLIFSVGSLSSVLLFWVSHDEYFSSGSSCAPHTEQRDIELTGSLVFLKASVTAHRARRRRPKTVWTWTVRYLGLPPAWSERRAVWKQMCVVCVAARRALTCLEPLGADLNEDASSLWGRRLLGLIASLWDHETSLSLSERTVTSPTGTQVQKTDSLWVLQRLKPSSRPRGQMWPSCSYMHFSFLRLQPLLNPQLQLHYDNFRY